MSRTWSQLLVAAMLATGWPLARPARAASRPPNILFVVIDTMRRDHVGCYGYERDTTPTLDRIAAEGARFDQAVVSSSWTMPSVMSMFTSVWPSLHNARNYESHLADGLTTLAEALKQGGYQTVGFTSNPTTSGKFGFDRGFDLYDDFTVLFGTGLDLFNEGNRGAGITAVPTSEKISRLAINWLRTRRAADKPFFLHVLYFDPHERYGPPAPFNRMFTDPNYRGKQDGGGIMALRGKEVNAADRRHITALYDGELRYTDHHLGRLLDAMRDLGLYDNTVIVVMSDHGEEFWDHDGLAHGHTLYDELVRVPLVIRFPAHVKPGATVATQVTDLDIMPTLLEFAGVAAPAQCQGRSLLPLLSGAKERLADRPAFMELQSEGDVYGVRTPTRKIILRDLGSHREMYLVSDDPQERRNLVDTPAVGKFKRLDASFHEWRQLMNAHRLRAEPSAPPKIDAELLRQLQSLGYTR